MLSIIAGSLVLSSTPPNYRCEIVLPRAVYYGANSNRWILAQQFDAPNHLVVRGSALTGILPTENGDTVTLIDDQNRVWGTGRTGSSGPKSIVVWETTNGLPTGYQRRVVGRPSDPGVAIDTVAGAKPDMRLPFRSTGGFGYYLNPDFTVTRFNGSRSAEVRRVTASGRVFGRAYNGGTARYMTACAWDDVQPVWMTFDTRSDAFGGSPSGIICGWTSDNIFVDSDIFAFVWTGPGATAQKLPQFATANQCWAYSVNDSLVTVGRAHDYVTKQSWSVLWRPGSTFDFTTISNLGSLGSTHLLRHVANDGTVIGSVLPNGSSEDSIFVARLVPRVTSGP